MENNVKPKELKRANPEVSRKEALKKIGYGAFTASTMMFLLSGTARAVDNNHGDWADINGSNGADLKCGSGEHDAHQGGPATSPDCYQNQKRCRLKVECGEGHCNNGEVHVEFKVCNKGEGPSSDSPQWSLKCGHSELSSHQIGCGTFSPIEGGGEHNFSYSFSYPQDQGDEMKIWLVVKHDDGFMGSNTTNGCIDIQRSDNSNGGGRK